jgi:hypothetical protein
MMAKAIPIRCLTVGALGHTAQNVGGMSFAMSKGIGSLTCHTMSRPSKLLNLLLPWRIVNRKLDTIMASQLELAAEVATKTAQIRKAIDEIQLKLSELLEQVRNAPAAPELTAAVSALSAAVQAADDIVPDAPPPPA